MKTPRHRPSQDQGSLTLWPRAHDLPPRWDGLPVQWGQWSDTGDVFLCPPPKPSPCGRCGSLRPPLLNSGRIWTDPRTAPPAIGKARLSGGRHLVGMVTVFRCPDCQHDTALDPAGEHWDLDETDYTDEGSFNVQESRSP